MDWRCSSRRNRRPHIPHLSRIPRRQRRSYRRGCLSGARSVFRAGDVGSLVAHRLLHALRVAGLDYRHFRRTALDAALLRMAVSKPSFGGVGHHRDCRLCSHSRQTSRKHRPVDARERKQNRNPAETIQSGSRIQRRRGDRRKKLMPGESSPTESKNVAVIGAGSWGTALAMVAAHNNHRVRLWAREREVADEVNRAHRNPFYLSDFELPDNIHATTAVEEAMNAANFALLVVPSHAMREMVAALQPFLNERIILVSAAKGVENSTLMRMEEVVGDVLRESFEPRYVALSGPSFAREVAKGDPTAIVAASRNREWSEMIQHSLSASLFRIYTNTDVVGVELGGAV